MSTNTEGDEDHRIGSHLLGPHVLGQRIVVRRRVPGETGPTGGPAMTDVLGVCEVWDNGVCAVRTADGALVEVPISLIISGKPIPPRPSVRLRTTPREAHLRTLDLWPGLEQVDLGDWVLRAAGPLPDRDHPHGRLVRRANSALAMGDPGVPPAEAATRVVDFYAERAQPAYAQVVADDQTDAALRTLGWTADGPDTLFQFASMSRLARVLGTPGDVATVEEDPAQTGAATVRVGDDASARLLLSDDWLGLDAVWVAPDRRRQGLARALLAEAVDWAASLGAMTTYLQVAEDNTAALTLYESLGFATHHTYRYLSPGDQSS